MKIYYCPPRPGDVWPPHESKRSNQNGGGNKGGNGPTREKSEKPLGCRKLFIGNLSYDIDDDTICDFFKDCGTPIGLRWLTRQGTNEFRVSKSFIIHIYAQQLIRLFYYSIGLWLYRIR